MNKIIHQNDEEVEELIAEGSYGKVYKINDKKNKRYLACKLRYFKDHQLNIGIPQDVIREITILKMLRSEYIISPIRTTIDNMNRVYKIYLEYYDTDLRQFYKENKLNEKQIKIIIYKILQGVKYLHSKRILHRDIKPSNILIKGKNIEKVVIADFGLATQITVPLNSFSLKVGTPIYRSPELIKHSQKNTNNNYNYYCTGVDMWCVGCIAVELMIGKPLFKSNNDADLIKEHITKLGKTNFPGIYEFYPDDFQDDLIFEQLKNFSPDFVELVKNMLIPEQLDRIEAIEALKSKVFEDINE
jgi:serine/threonine protein kinase